MPLTQVVTIRGLLKESTSAAHAKAEALLLPKLNSLRTYDDYAVILKMFYGYFHPVEKQIAKYITADMLSDIHERRSSASTISDLKSIGYPAEHLAVADQLPQTNSVAGALGAMYVLEGSTLGGRVIAKMQMRQCPGMFNEANLTFFNGYGEDSGKKWMSFLSLVDHYADESDLIINAANETFNCLTRWMEKVL
jgi:heme oxygenase